MTMKNQARPQNQPILSRRQLLGGAAAAAALTMVPRSILPTAGAQGMGKPNSNFGGVQIGAITYSFRGMPGTAGDVLKHVTRCGLGAVHMPHAVCVGTGTDADGVVAIAHCAISSLEENDLPGLRSASQSVGSRGEGDGGR